MFWGIKKNDFETAQDIMYAMYLTWHCIISYVTAFHGFILDGREEATPNKLLDTYNKLVKCIIKPFNFSLQGETVL